MSATAGLARGTPTFWPFAGWARRSAAGALPVVGFAILSYLVYRYDAPTALGAAMFLALTGLLLLRPQLATQLMVFLLYLNVPAIAHKYHGVPQPVAGAFMLLLLIPLGHHLIVRREAARGDVALRLMLLFLAVLLISSLSARGAAVAADRITTFIFEGLLLYWLLINVVRDLPGLRRVIWTLLVAGSVLGALSLYQEVTGSFDQQFGGLAHRNHAYMVLEQELAANPDDPELRDLKASMRDDRSRRAEGPMDEPNMYAQIMLVLLPLALFAYRAAESRRSRLAAAASGALIFGGLVVAQSRGAFVALLLVVLAAMAIRWIRPKTVLLCALALLPTLPLVLSDRLIARVASITTALSVLQNRPATEGDPAIEGRATEMLAAFQVFRDHPLLGVGPGQYMPYYSVEYHQKNPRLKFRDIRIPRRAHSLYLELGAEVGAVGLAVFLAIVSVLLRALWRARIRWRESDAPPLHLATALLLSMTGYLATGIFLHLMYERYFWLVLALAGAAIHAIHALERDEDGSERGMRCSPSR